MKALQLLNLIAENLPSNFQRQIIRTIYYVARRNSQEMLDMLRFTSDEILSQTLIVGNFKSIEDIRAHCFSDFVSYRGGHRLVDPIDFAVEIKNLSNKFPFLYYWIGESGYCIAMTDRKLLEMDNFSIDLANKREIYNFVNSIENKETDVNQQQNQFDDYNVDDVDDVDPDGD